MILLYRKYSGLQKKLSWLCPDNCALFLNNSVAFYVKRSRCFVTVFCVLHAKAFKKNSKHSVRVLLWVFVVFSFVLCVVYVQPDETVFCRVRSFFLKTSNMFLSKPVHRVFIVYVLARLKQVWVGGGFNCFPPV